MIVIKLTCFPKVLNQYTSHLCRLLILQRVNYNLILMKFGFALYLTSLLHDPGIMYA